MNSRSLLIACLATLGLAVAGWGAGDDEQWWGGLGRRGHTPPD